VMVCVDVWWSVNECCCVFLCVDVHGVSVLLYVICDSYFHLGVSF